MDFDVNKRVVYSIQSYGLGYAGMETVMALMNLPPPLTRKNFNKLTETIKNAIISQQEDARR